MPLRLTFSNPVKAARLVRSNEPAPVKTSVSVPDPPVRLSPLFSVAPAPTVALTVLAPDREYTLSLPVVRLPPLVLTTVSAT